jgi:hypothetical protein
MAFRSPPVVKPYCDVVTPLTDVVGVLLVVVAPAAESSEVIPWLIPINCCRLFTSTICEMYALGSVGCVGSWFFISATSRVRKSFAVIVELSVDAEDAAVLLAVLLVDAPEAAVDDVLGLASAPATLAAAADCCVLFTIC